MRRAGVLGLFAQAGERLDQARHAVGRVVKIADFDVVGPQHLGGLQQAALAAVRFGLAAAVHEPIRQELELQVLHAVIVHDAFHLFQRAVQHVVLQVGMPDADAFKAGPGGGFDPVFEIEAADFVVPPEYPGGGPVQGH